MIGLLGIPILLNERNISYETYVSIHRNAYISTYIGAYISYLKLFFRKTIKLFKR